MSETIGNPADDMVRCSMTIFEPSAHTGKKTLSNRRIAVLESLKHLWVCAHPCNTLLSCSESRRSGHTRTVLIILQTSFVRSAIMHSCANSPWDCAVVVLLVGTLIFKSEGKPAAVHIGEPVGFESVPVRAFGGLIELDTEGMNSFRVSVSINKDEKPLKTDTPMIPSGRTNKAKFTSVTDGSYKGNLIGECISRIIPTCV